MLAGPGEEWSARPVRGRSPPAGHHVGHLRLPARGCRLGVLGVHGSQRGDAAAGPRRVVASRPRPARRPRGPRSGCCRHAAASRVARPGRGDHGDGHLDGEPRERPVRAGARARRGRRRSSRRSARGLATHRPAGDDTASGRARRGPAPCVADPRPPPRSIGWPSGSRWVCRRWRIWSASEQLELLDRAGLLTVRLDGRRQIVTLSHPMHGEILRARMPALTRRRLLLEHADHLDAHGARRREDAIRSATARLEASGSADADLLVGSARLARYGHDFATVERLARAALRDGMTSEIGLLLGEALHEIGSTSRRRRYWPRRRQSRPTTIRSSLRSSRSAPAT